MRFALAQINTTVGDVEGNARLILEAVGRARAQGADVVLVPELAVLGYPPKDLLLKEGFVERSEEAVAAIAGECRDLVAIVGSPRRHKHPTGWGVSNSAAICRHGRVEHWYDKRLLPTYDVFDESRYFDPGREPFVFEHHGRLIGVTICEDLWNDQTMLERRLYAEDVVSDLVESGAETIVNISASPFSMGKPLFRRQLFGRVATRARVPVVCCNLVGGNDDLIFDGYSVALGPDGGLIAAACGFAEEFLTVELPTDQRLDPHETEHGLPGRAPGQDSHELEAHAPELADLFDALVLGVRDYLRKCGFGGAIIALSGGIDSAVVAAIARAAIGPDRVRGIGMPSRFSSPGSIDDARDLAERLGIRFDVVSIEPAHEAMLDMLRPLFEESGRPPGVAEENIQARLRGNVVMSLSNKTGDLLLSTGNKSELAVGYCTLYGDMAGGLAVISDVPKTTVYRLARWMNAHPERLGLERPPIPENTITKPPSAELRPNQTDQDSLPPYEALDAIIERYVERGHSVERIIREIGPQSPAPPEHGLPARIEETTIRAVARLIDRNEYKRRQMPVGLKVTGRAFGTGWRMPIAAKGL